MFGDAGDLADSVGADCATSGEVPGLTEPNPTLNVPQEGQDDQEREHLRREEVQSLASGFSCIWPRRSWDSELSLLLMEFRTCIPAGSLMHPLQSSTHLKPMCILQMHGGKSAAEVQSSDVCIILPQRQDPDHEDNKTARKTH